MHAWNFLLEISEDAWFQIFVVSNFFLPIHNQVPRLCAFFLLHSPLLDDIMMVLFTAAGEILLTHKRYYYQACL